MDDKNKLIEKLGELSAKAYMFGRMYHIDEVTELTKDINELIAKVFGYSPWHTGTPTEEGLYVVLTEVETIGIHSSKGTYLLDWWDGYFFKNLKDIVQNSPIHRMREYSWIKWQKIKED